MRVRKNISLDDTVLDKAQKQADLMFSGNFSMYLTYLINKDCRDIALDVVENNNEIVKDEQIKIEDDVLSEIDNIIDM